MKLLVTGATGYVGSRLVSALLLAGHQVVAAARDSGKLEAFDWLDEVETVDMDVLNEDSVRTAMEAAGQVDAAYYLVHALGEGDYEVSDAKAAHVFTDAAAQANVLRVVYLGGFVPADSEMSPHLASRSQVGTILRDGPVDTVVLQAAVILGAGSTSFEIVRHLVSRLPVVPLPAFMNHLVQPIAVDDVLRYLVAAADPELLPGGTYDIAGPDRLSYAELARTLARVAGLRRVFVPVPFISEQLAARIIGPLIPVPAALVSDLVHSLGTSMITDDDTAERLVPGPGAGLTTVRDAIARALQPAPAPTPGRSRLPRPSSDHQTASEVGTHAQEDPLTLADTDAEWAGPPSTGSNRS